MRVQTLCSNKRRHWAYSASTGLCHGRSWQIHLLAEVLQQSCLTRLEKLSHAILMPRKDANSVLNLNLVCSASGPRHTACVKGRRPSPPSSTWNQIESVFIQRACRGLFLHIFHLFQWLIGLFLLLIFIVVGIIPSADLHEQGTVPTLSSLGLVLELPTPKSHARDKTISSRYILLTGYADSLSFRCCVKRIM